MDAQNFDFDSKFCFLVKKFGNNNNFFLQCTDNPHFLVSIPRRHCFSDEANYIITDKNV